MGSDTLIWSRLVKEDLLTFMSDFEGCQPVRWLFMSNLCRVSGKSIQFVYNIHEGKGREGCTESLWELTASAEKLEDLIIWFKQKWEPQKWYFKVVRWNDVKCYTKFGKIKHPEKLLKTCWTLRSTSVAKKKKSLWLTNVRDSVKGWHPSRCVCLYKYHSPVR